MGFGAASRIQAPTLLRLSEGLPEVVELANSEEQINQSLPFPDELVRGVPVTMERILVRIYRPDEPA